MQNSSKWSGPFRLEKSHIILVLQEENTNVLRY